MRQGRFLICIVCAVTAASSRKNFDKPSISTEKSFYNSKGVRIRSKQCFVVPFWNTEAVLQAMSLYIQRPLPCKSLLGAAQTRCSASCRCRLRIFAKCSFSTPQECNIVELNIIKYCGTIIAKALTEIMLENQKSVSAVQEAAAEQFKRLEKEG